LCSLALLRLLLQTVNDEAIWDWIDQKVPLSKNDTGLKRAVLTPQKHIKRFTGCVAERWSYRLAFSV
jgi:hypothetical protein